jgi:hypothetical protein
MHPADPIARKLHQWSHKPDEVRGATLTCTVDPEGKFVDAFDPKAAPTNSGDGSQPPEIASFLQAEL